MKKEKSLGMYCGETIDKNMAPETLLKVIEYLAHENKRLQALLDFGDKMSEYTFSHASERPKSFLKKLTKLITKQ